MSANINITREKRVLMVVANPSISKTTGWPVGFWWSELTHPYWKFIESGYQVEIRSPEGGTLEADSFSDPEDSSGYSADDFLSLGFKKSSKHAALLQNTQSLANVDPKDYEAIFLVGGQSPMYTFRNHEKLHRLVADFYEAGKVTALVCHATCVLLETRLSTGMLLVENKTWTGFSNAEEQFADNIVGKKIQPFWIEQEAKKLTQSNFITGPAFREFAVRDKLLVTGQQQFSGTAAAVKVIEALGC